MMVSWDKAGSKDTIELFIYKGNIIPNTNNKKGPLTSKLMVAFIPQIQFVPTDIREARPADMTNISNAKTTCVDPRGSLDR